MSTTYQVSDGDFFINPDTGRLAAIRDEVKLSQDLASALMLDLDVDRDFGSRLNELEQPQSIGSSSLIKQFVADAVARLQNYQRDDAQASRAEIIKGINAINVIQSDGDKTSYLFYLEVQNEEDTNQSTIMKLTAPTSLNHQTNDNVTSQNTLENYAFLVGA